MFLLMFNSFGIRHFLMVAMEKVAFGEIYKGFRKSLLKYFIFNPF